MSDIEIIIEAIIEMDKPFRITDLYIKLKQEHNIDDRKMILEVLQDLLNNGVVNYLEISDNVWAYSSMFA